MRHVFDEATRAAEAGIKRAADNAGASWVAIAADELGWAASRADASEFTVEELRWYIRTHGDEIAEPPDLRAWGAATQRAARMGFIVRTGHFARAASSNGSPKPLYRFGRWPA